MLIVCMYILICATFFILGNKSVDSFVDLYGKGMFIHVELPIVQKCGNGDSG